MTDEHSTPDKRKTTDQLREIAKQVFQEERDLLRQELKADLKQTIEQTLPECLKDANFVTKTEVEEVVTKKMRPYQDQLDQAAALHNDLATLQRAVADLTRDFTALNLLASRLSGVVTFLEELPTDLRDLREQDDKVEARVTTNELALKGLHGDFRGLERNIDMATMSALNIQRRFFGDPNNPDEPSVLRDLKSQWTGQHSETMVAINTVKVTLAEIVPQVKANTRFRENRRKIEQGVLRIFQFASGLWDERKRTIIAGIITAVVGGLITAIIALLSDPSVQKFLTGG